jgi:hypothetical protein
MGNRMAEGGEKLVEKSAEKDAEKNAENRAGAKIDLNYYFMIIVSSITKCHVQFVSKRRIILPIVTILFVKNVCTSGKEHVHYVEDPSI